MSYGPSLIGRQVGVGLAVPQNRQIARGETRGRNQRDVLQFTSTE